MPTNICCLEELSIDALTVNVGALARAKDVPENVNFAFGGEKPVPLPSNLGNKLLVKLRERKKMDENSLKLFKKETVSLTKIDLSHCTLPAPSMEIFAQHSLQEANLYGMENFDLTHFVSHCLNSETRELTLKRLNIGGITPLNLPFSFGPLAQLTSLKVLTVSETDFDDTDLVVVCKNLNSLSFLDISRSKVTKIDPLEFLKNTLTALIMHRVLLSKDCETSPLDVINSLPNLEILDISDAPNSSPTDTTKQDWSRTLGTPILTSIEHPNLTKLRILDLSGQQINVDGLVIERFLKRNEKLEFLGLLLTNTCFLPELMKLENLQVAGDATRSQVLCSLRTYWRPSRDAFTSRALYAAFNELQNNYDLLCHMDTKEYLFCINRTMSSDMKNLSVQMAGTACLYHLCKHERVKGLLSSDIRNIVDRCLDAAESHPKVIQLHKNVWLTLCNDYILQSVAFNISRCCSVALESMTNNPDPAVSRLTVAIVSILVAKIPTEKTAILGTNKRYMSFLLSLVTEKLAEHVTNQQQNNHLGDVTLKFTLSALWNLTDESPKTCELFMREGGLYAVLQVLHKFPENASVQTKVLGLLNNVAEVRSLQPKMVETWCLETLVTMAARGRGIGRGDAANNDGNWPRRSAYWSQAGRIWSQPQPGDQPRPSTSPDWSQAGRIWSHPRPGIATSNNGASGTNGSNSNNTVNRSNVGQPINWFRPIAPTAFSSTNVLRNPQSRFVDAFHGPVEQQIQASNSAFRTFVPPSEPEIELCDGVPTLLDEPESPEPPMTTERKHELGLRQEIAGCRRVARGRRAERKKQRHFDWTNKQLADSGDETIPLRDRPFNRLVHIPYYARLLRARNELDSLNLPSSSRHVPDFLAVADNASFATAYQVDPIEAAKYRSLQKVQLTGDDDFCTVCHEAIEDATSDLLRCEACQKLFHEDCLVPWLAEYKECPNCRHIWPRNNE